jgi:hypothetical protein
MPDTAKAWAPGDRVRLVLPDNVGNLGRKGADYWFTGTVREVDSESHPGVRVDLDEVVNGVTDCYASHAELRTG